MDIDTLCVNIFTVDEASAVNMVDMYIREHFVFSHEDFFRKVAEEGNTSFSKWLFSHYSLYSGIDDICEKASISGNLKLVKFLIKCGFKFKSQYNAAYHRRRNILAWCHKYKRLDHDSAFSGAIKSGDYETVKWLISLGYKPERYHCGTAVKYNNLEILKLLIYNGCNPHRKFILDRAIANSNLPIVKYLLEFYDYEKIFKKPSGSCGNMYDSSHFFDNAVSTENPKIVEALLDHKCPPSDNLDPLVDNKEYKLVRRCLDLGSSWTFSDYRGDKDKVMDESPEDFRVLVLHSQLRTRTETSCLIC